MEKLAAAGERELVRRRHAEYFRNQARAADLRYGTGSTDAWLASVELEIDNYRAVLEWTLTGGHDNALGGAVAGALARLWLNGGLTVEGRYWIGQAQVGLDESAHPQVAARLWRALGPLSDGKRRHECAERALALYRSLGDTDGAAWSILSLAFALFQMGRLDEAIEANASALAVLRTSGNKLGVAACLAQQATNHRCRGDVSAARDLYSQALEAYNVLRDDVGKAAVLGNLADLEFADGRAQQALRLVGDALTIIAGAKNRTNLATTYSNSAVYHIALGDPVGAREAAREALRWAQQAQYAAGVAIVLQHFALVGSLCGQLHDAARLIGYVNVQYEKLGTQRESTEKWGYERLMVALRERISEAEIEKLAVEGAAWSEDHAVEQAMKA